MIELLGVAGVPGAGVVSGKRKASAIRLTPRRMSCYRARMQMTRLAPQPACARVRQLVAVWLGCVFWMSVSASARAQVRAELERALTVTRELPGCVSAPALRARTAQYLDRVEPLSELTIEVDLQVPQFRVLRDGTLLAERRFARAPSDCAERRDALALALAIAIEQVAEGPAAISGKRVQPTAAAATAPDGGAQRAPTSGDASDEARSGARRTAPSATGSGDSSEQARSGARRTSASATGSGDSSEQARSGARRTAAGATGSGEPADEARSGARSSSASATGSDDPADEARSGARNTAASGDSSEEARSGARSTAALVEPGPRDGSGRARGDDARTAQDAPASRESDTRAEARGVATAESASDRTDDRALPPSAADRGPGDARDLTREGRPRAWVALLGGGAVLFEALPTAAAGFSLGAELALLPAVRIALSGLFSLPVSSAFQGGTVSAQLFGAQLTGCVNTPLFASILLHGCAGAVGGVIEASGDDFALNLSDRMGWIAGMVRARLEFPATGRVAAGVYADARVNVLRPELQAGLASEPARTRAVGLMGAALGAELIVRLH
jgi:hypothetical protein